MWRCSLPYLASVKRATLTAAWGSMHGGKLPPREFALALLFILAGGLGIFSVLFPFSDTAPTTATLLVSACGIAGGLLVLRLEKPVSNTVILIYSMFGIILLSFLISNSTTQLGTAVASMPFIWFCVYFGAYLEPRAARVQIVVLCVAFGIALIVSDVPASISAWLIYSATIVVTTEALLATSYALREQARRDPLTGLLNRRGLEEAAGLAIAIDERVGQSTSVAMIDLDDFKSINDSEGHLAGDRALRELAGTWASEKREADLLARLGGDEFVLVMPATDENQAKQLIKRYRSAHPVQWSCGIVEVRPGEALPVAVDRADRALYEVKADRVPGSGRIGMEAPAVPESGTT